MNRPVSRGNVTVDPLSPAAVVLDPEIKEILDLETGEIIDAKQFIAGKRYEELVPERNLIRERLSKKPMFGCALCTTPVYIVSTQEKRFFFRHVAENGSCPAQTRGALSQDEILAHKYHGLRESDAHRKIKELIERSLRADPSFSDIRSERQWRSSFDPSSLRRPDVQAVGATGRIAFEAQLSTTFLNVVVGRRAFYREDGGLLVWIMRSFDPDYRRMTTDDILFSNNSNIFVVDEETAALSETSQKFHLRCHHRAPERHGNTLVDRWESRIVRFEELTIEHDAQRAWFFDYEGKAAAIRAEIEHDHEVIDDALRHRLITFWLNRDFRAGAEEAWTDQWAALCSDFEARGFTLPEHPDRSTKFRALLNGLTSAKAGHPVGWDFKQLVEVGHYVANSHPEHLVALGHAFRHFGREALLDQQDKSGKWSRRRTAIRRAIRSYENAFQPDTETLNLLGFLFPEIGEKTRSLAEKWLEAVEPT